MKHAFETTCIRLGIIVLLANSTMYVGIRYIGDPFEFPHPHPAYTHTIG